MSQSFGFEMRDLMLVDQGAAIMRHPDPENEDASIGLAQILGTPETRKAHLIPPSSM